jgi:hypothetical protein
MIMHKKLGLVLLVPLISAVLIAVPAALARSTSAAYSGTFKVNEVCIYNCQQTGAFDYGEWAIYVEC